MPNDADRAIPPYIAWKSFKGFIEHLKQTTTPDVLDNSVRPPTMAGGLWAQVRSALKYMGFVDPHFKTTDRLKQLVDAYETDRWATTLTPIITETYAGIGGHEELAKLTSGQLNERFKALGLEGQMREKAIRFYLAAFEEVGATISPLLKMRGARTAGRRLTRFKVNVPPTPKFGGGEERRPDPQQPNPPSALPEGFIAHPFQLRRDLMISVVLPADLTTGDVDRLSKWLATLPID